MIIEPKPGLVRVVHEEHFHYPAILRAKCPECSRDASRDLESIRLREPPFGVPFKEDMWCPHCDHEWKETMQLDVTLRSIPDPAAPKESEEK